MNILICLLINELSLYLHTYFKLYIRYQVPGVVKYQYRIRLYVDYSTPYLVCRYCCCWIREQRAPHTPCTSICAFNSQVPLPMNSTLCSRWPRRKNHGEWTQNEECVTHNEGMTYNEGMAHTESTPTKHATIRGRPRFDPLTDGPLHQKNLFKGQMSWTTINRRLGI